MARPAFLPPSLVCQNVNLAFITVSCRPALHVQASNPYRTPMPTGSGPQQVDKGCDAPLPAPIRRVFYLAADEHHPAGTRLQGQGAGGEAGAGGGGLGGPSQEHEVYPAANPRVLQVRD